MTTTQPLDTTLHHHLLIAGKEVRGGGRAQIAVADPATGEVLGHLPQATDDDIDAALAATVHGFAVWRGTNAYERAAVLREVARRMREQAHTLAALLTAEQGKTLREAQGEAAGSADLFAWLAEEGTRVYGRVVPARRAGLEQRVLHEPVGPVAAFAPWNYPLSLAARKVAHALAAGCSVILKPAEEAPGAVILMAKICLASGVPAEALQVLFGDPAHISARLIASPVIRKVTFTGSVAVGKHLATLAAPGLKRTTFELGGHAPVIVMDDVDVDRVAELCVPAKFRNAGQICISPTRFIVHDRVYDRLAERFAEGAQRLKVGPGAVDGVDMGPLAQPRRVAAMRALVDDALQCGARVLTGGAAVEGPGAFWQPTVLCDVPPQARVMQEEPFGPLAPFSRVHSLDEALGLANSLDYGLAAYAFTRSMGHAQRLRDELSAGVVGINTLGVTAPEMPFSGIHDSGLGVAMGSEGLLDHMNIKSVFEAIP